MVSNGDREGEKERKRQTEKEGGREGGTTTHKYEGVGKNASLIFQIRIFADSIQYG